MRTLTIAFKLDDGSGSLATPSISLDNAIATRSLILKRICITTTTLNQNRFLSIELPFLNRTLCNQAITPGITVVIPGSKKTRMTVCDERYDINNNQVPKKFKVKITDISTDTNASATIPPSSVALIFETEGRGTI